MQWNDRFREDARGFLRGEPGMLAALRQRVQGSPDLFDSPMESVNFVACHDGFTLYDVVAYDHKHNEDNGWSGADGASENRSWNCGWEGDDGVPDEVLALRRRQLRNAWCLLALSHGVPMAGMGDELGRTQGGNNNAYNQDNETSWVDWDRATEFADLERFVSALLAVRARHPVLAQPTFWGDAVRFSEPDAEGRALTWQVGDLYVLANAWWEPVDVALEEPGPWRRVVDTSLEPPEDIVDRSSGPRCRDDISRGGPQHGRARAAGLSARRWLRSQAPSHTSTTSSGWSGGSGGMWVKPASRSTVCTAGSTRSSWKRCQSSAESHTPMCRRPLSVWTHELGDETRRPRLADEGFDGPIHVLAGRHVVEERIGHGILALARSNWVELSLTDRGASTQCRRLSTPDVPTTRLGDASRPAGRGWR